MPVAFDVSDWSWLTLWSGKPAAKTRSEASNSASNASSASSTRTAPTAQAGPSKIMPPNRSDSKYRIRMMNMEKQLASLSTLVHSALMTKGVSETMYKDLEMLRKEIIGSGGPPSSSGGTRDDSLSDNGSVSRFSDLSSDKGSYQSNNTDKGKKRIYDTGRMGLQNNFCN